MTVIEIALAIVLVAGAGWLVRGFASLRSTDLGFTADNRVIFDVAFLGARYPNPASVDAASRTLRERLAALPGVTGVGATSNFPFRNSLEGSLIAQFHGEPLDAAHPVGTRRRFVSPGYFKSTGTRLLEGRDFGPDDRQGTRAVAIINKAFVKRYLNGRNAIGLQFSAGYPAPDPRNEVSVVGVVDDVRQKTVFEEAEPAFYSPLAQVPLRRQTMVVATSTSDVASLESAIRSQVRELDPQIAVEFELVRDLVNGTLRRQQLGMTLMLIFGVVAILLAAVGIYGVVAYAVSQRRGEMATRLALGATPGSVFVLVMKQGALLALIGIGIGLLVAYLSGRVVASQIYAIRASDPVTLGAAIVLVAGITGLATMIPAWRASRLAPSGVLHTE
jgi:predicted permease